MKDFARFNPCPHIDIDLPDGDQTISVRMSNGKRVTFAFLEEEKGGPAHCIDIKYHDGGDVTQAIGFARRRDTFDTRKNDIPTRFLTILLLDEDYKK